MDPQCAFFLLVLKKITQNIGDIFPIELTKLIIIILNKLLLKNFLWCGYEQTMLKINDKYYFQNCSLFPKIDIKNILQFAICNKNIMILDKKF